MSEPANVHEALLAFHAESPTLQKTKLNPAFRSKYIALEHLIAEITPLLVKHGLVWATFPESVDGDPTLRYELVHAKTQTKIEGRMALQSKGNLPQDQGSAITYARRYSMMAVLNLAADEDDDGSRASEARAARPTTAPLARLVALSTGSRELVLNGIDRAGADQATVFAAVGLARAEDMTAADAHAIRAYLDGMKR